MPFEIEFDDKDVPFLRLGDYILRIDLEELTGEFKERAAKELRETPENVEYGIRKLRQFIEAEPYLKIPVDDEAFLTKFLRPCKYYPESAFKLIKKYYKFKLKYPQYCQNLTPASIKHVFDNEVFVFLPTRSQMGARIKIINIGTKWNPKVVKLEDMFKAVMVGVEIAMLEPKSQLGGAEVIINVQGLKLCHVYQFTPSLAKLIVEWIQECIPVRLKGIHIINQPYIFNLLYAIFKPFLYDKLKKRIFFHGSNRKSLLEKISPECLPEYLGGTANIPEYPGSAFSEMLFQYEADFELHNTYGYHLEGEETKEKAVELEANNCQKTK